MKILWFCGFIAFLCLIPCRSLAADGPKSFQVGEFSFSSPLGWEWVPVTSSMRKAELRINDKDKKNKAEVIFFHFGESDGGGVKANVDRWLGQFQEPREKINAKIDETKVKTHKVTYVQAEGTYMSGMPGGPKTAQPNSMLMGAILESPQGSVFIRMTGPAELVKASRDEFKKMVEDALNQG
jgi:hypothetical protein